MSKQQYEKYCRISGQTDCGQANCDLIELGQVPEHFDASVLIPKGIPKRSTADISFRSYADFEAYLKFARETIAAYSLLPQFVMPTAEVCEKPSPLAMLEAPTQPAREPVYADMFVLNRNIQIDCVEPYSTITTLYDLTMEDSKYTPIDFESVENEHALHIMLSDTQQLNELSEKYEDRKYIGFSWNHEANTIYYRTAFKRWVPIPKDTNIEEFINGQTITLLKIRQGAIILDTPDGFWSNTGSSGIFSRFECAEKLFMCANFLEWTTDKHSEVRRLATEKQCEAMRALITAADETTDMNLENLFRLFDHKIHPSSPIAPIACSIDFAAREFAATHSALPEYVRNDPELQTRLRKGAFILFLNQNRAKYSDAGVDTCLEYLKSNEYTGTMGSPELAPNTLFCESLDLPKTEIYEIRLLLSLTQVSNADLLIKRRSYMFKNLVMAFHQLRLEEKADSKYPSSLLWYHFTNFVDIVPCANIFVESQATFNEIMNTLGWECKRISSGKVWMNLNVKEMRAPVVF